MTDTQVKTFVAFLLGWLMAAVLIGLFVLPTLAEENPTDPQLFLDTQTGCEYFGNHNGQITPRLHVNGKHIGCKPTNGIQMK